MSPRFQVKVRTYTAVTVPADSGLVPAPLKNVKYWNSKEGGDLGGGGVLEESGRPGLTLGEDI